MENLQETIVVTTNGVTDGVAADKVAVGTGTAAVVSASTDTSIAQHPPSVASASVIQQSTNNITTDGNTASDFKSSNSIADMVQENSIITTPRVIERKRGRPTKEESALRKLLLQQQQQQQPSNSSTKSDGDDDDNEKISKEQQLLYDDTDEYYNKPTTLRSGRVSKTKAIFRPELYMKPKKSRLPKVGNTLKEGIPGYHNKWKSHRENFIRHLSVLIRETKYSEAYSNRRNGSFDQNEVSLCKDRMTGAKRQIRNILRKISEEDLDHKIWKELGDDEGLGEEIEVENINCSRCLSDSEEGNDILFCDKKGCCKAYHQNCLDPPVFVKLDRDENGNEINQMNSPSQVWFCWKCETMEYCMNKLNEFREAKKEREFQSWFEVYPEFASIEENKVHTTQFANKSNSSSSSSRSTSSSSSSSRNSEFSSFQPGNSNSTTMPGLTFQQHVLLGSASINAPPPVQPLSSVASSIGTGHVPAALDAVATAAITYPQQQHALLQQQIQQQQLLLQQQLQQATTSMQMFYNSSVNNPLNQQLQQQQPQLQQSLNIPVAMNPDLLFTSDVTRNALLYSDKSKVYEAPDNDREVQL